MIRQLLELLRHRSVLDRLITDYIQTAQGLIWYGTRDDNPPDRMAPIQLHGRLYMVGMDGIDTGMGHIGVKRLTLLRIDQPPTVVEFPYDCSVGVPPPSWVVDSEESGSFQAVYVGPEPTDDGGPCWLDLRDIQLHDRALEVRTIEMRWCGPSGRWCRDGGPGEVVINDYHRGPETETYAGFMASYWCVDGPDFEPVGPVDPLGVEYFLDQTDAVLFSGIQI